MSRSAQTTVPVIAAPPSPPPVGRWPKPAVRAVLHVLIVFHLVAVTGWSFTSAESKSRLHRTVRSKAEWYVQPLGLWQTWKMFAPNPWTSNNYVEAEVTFRDGGGATWSFPRVERLGYFTRYRMERYRKWGNERVWAAGSFDPLVAEAAAQFAARQVGRGSEPVERVDLVRYRAPIPSPKGPTLVPHDATPRGWDRQVFFTWRPAGPSTAPATTPATVPTDPASRPSQADDTQAPAEGGS